MKKIFFGGIIAMFALIAHANCRVDVVRLPEGGVQYCQTCCTPNGHCQVTHCWR